MKPCQTKVMNEKDYKDNLLFPGRNSLIAFREAKDELVGVKMELHHADVLIEWLNCELEKNKQSIMVMADFFALMIREKISKSER